MTYPYPSSVNEAAKILDIANPGWEKKIDLSRLDMENSYVCILGQLYNSYSDGMKSLFYQNYSEYIHKRNCDKIFGIEASKEEWVKEINNRLSIGFNFAWALSQINAGKRITHSTLGDNYLWKAENYLRDRQQNVVNFNNLYIFSELVGWKEYRPEIIVKVGDKVRDIQENRTYIVVNVELNKYNMFDIENGCRWTSPNIETSLKNIPLSMFCKNFPHHIEDFVLVRE